MPQKIAIIGPGLLGTSIALAARRAGSAPVAIWARRRQIIWEIRERGIADLVSDDLRAVVEEAGTIVFCVPIGAMSPLAHAIEPHLHPNALVTDVGSVKAVVVTELSSIFQGRGRFIGSHPMAGSEQTGHAAASADLFDGRVCILTPDAATNPSAITDATDFWQSLGGIVRALSPAEHDEIVALISHLPHLLAATLVNTVAAQKPDAFEFHGPGFFDTTRIAAGAPEMWAEILWTNQTAVRASAEAMIEKLRETITLLDRAGPLHEFLTQAKDLRERLRNSNPNV